MTEVTRILSRYVVNSTPADVPDPVRREGVRSFLNWVGSLAHPMSDKDLEAKFKGMAAEVIGPKATERLIEMCWGLADAPDVAKIARAAAAQVATAAE